MALWIIRENWSCPSPSSSLMIFVIIWRERNYQTNKTIISVSHSSLCVMNVVYCCIWLVVLCIVCITVLLAPSTLLFGRKSGKNVFVWMHSVMAWNRNGANINYRIDFDYCWIKGYSHCTWLDFFLFVNW